MSSGAIVGTTVYRGSELVSAGTAVAWKGGQIAAVGNDDDIRAFADHHGIDLRRAGGGCVLPGFVDSHAHLSALGLAEKAADLSPATNVKDVLLTLEAAETGEEVILANGLDEATLTEKRPPNRRELDRAFPKRPVFINDRGLHYVVCNTACIRFLGIESLEEHNGRLSEHASGRARGALGNHLTDEFRRDALHVAAQAMAEGGFTSVHAVEGGDLFDDRDIPILIGSHDLPVDVTVFWNTTDVQRVKDSGLPRLGGDIFVDGSLGSRTAQLKSPYSDDPSTCGQSLIDDEAMTSLIADADDLDLQIAFHAIGDLAIQRAIGAFERAQVNTLARHRIEHFGLADDASLARAAELGIVISTQPSFPYLRSGRDSIYESRLGAERARQAYPLARFASSGATVAAGTDAPVTPPSALLGIEACLNHPYEEQRVDLNTAVAWFTIGGALASHQEATRGRLEVGKVADLVLLSEDIGRVKSSGLANVGIEVTISKGRLVAGESKARPSTNGLDQEVGS